MHTNINNNALKNTRVNAFFQLYYQVTVIILKYSNSTQLEISSSAEVAVVFRKHEKRNTDLRSPVEWMRVVGGLVLLYQSLVKPEV